MSNSAFSKVNIPVPVTVANGGTGAATFTDGGVLIGNGTSAVQVTSAGTAGQVLTSNGAGVDPTFQDAASVQDLPWSVPMTAESSRPMATDDVQFMPFQSSNTLSLYRTAPVAESLRYIGTNAQSTTAANVQASATSATGAVVQGGFVYWFVRNGVTTVWLYRASVTTDISNSANWTQVTLSGANFAPTFDQALIGYGNGAFWFVDNSNSVYFPATLSGTTFTQGSTITVTGSDYGSESMVNNQGVLASFSGTPRLRLANFSGTLQTDKTIQGVNAVPTYSIEDKFYLRNSTANTAFRIDP